MSIKLSEQDYRDLSIPDDKIISDSGTTAKPVVTVDYSTGMHQESGILYSLIGFGVLLAVGCDVATAFCLIIAVSLLPIYWSYRKLKKLQDIANG